MLYSQDLANRIQGVAGAWQGGDGGWMGQQGGLQAGQQMQPADCCTTNRRITALRLDGLQRELEWLRIMHKASGQILWQHLSGGGDKRWNMGTILIWVYNLYTFHTVTNISDMIMITVNCYKVCYKEWWTFMAQRFQFIGHWFTDILCTGPGLSELDYCVVVYSIIFCNGISAV